MGEGNQGRVGQREAFLAEEVTAGGPGRVRTVWNHTE